MDTLRETLRVENLYWDLYGQKYNSKNAPFSTETMVTLNAVMAPLNENMHGTLFSMRSSATTLALLRASMPASLFGPLRTAFPALYRLECTEPACGNAALRGQALAVFDSLDVAADKLAAAERLIDEALVAYSRAADELVAGVVHRRNAVFEHSVAKAAHVAEPASALDEDGAPRECYYCCEPIAPDRAGWIGSPQCKHANQVTCRTCIINIVFASSQRGTQPHGVCPLCRTNFTWQDVYLTGAAPAAATAAAANHAPTQ